MPFILTKGVKDERSAEARRQRAVLRVGQSELGEAAQPEVPFAPLTECLLRAAGRDADAFADVYDEIGRLVARAAQRSPHPRHHLRHADVARLMQAPVGTTKTRIRNALRLLRETVDASLVEIA